MRQPLRATAAALVILLALAAPACAQANRPHTPPAPSAAGAMAWSSLGAEQKAALRPLRELWPALGTDHQRKWIALAQNFSRLPAHEQATLQQRMTEWARLSPAQRARARLNFDTARRIPDDERLQRWQQYQALPPVERERLTRERPKPPPVGAAPALRRAPAGSAPGARPAPKSSAPVNRHTLLPEAPEPPAKNTPAKSRR